MKAHSLALFAVLTLCFSARAVTEPTIDRITFAGNPPASSGTLLRGSGLGQGVSIFLVSQRQVADAVVSNLMSMGYLDCSVTVTWPRWGSESYEVIIDVDPGPISLRGQLSFSGDTTFTAEQLSRLCPLDLGDPVAPSDTASYALAIRNRYASRGYLRAEVEVQLAQVSDTLSRGYRDLMVTIQRNDRYYLGGISVSGLYKVRQTVVTREFDISPGEPLNMDRMREGISALYALGLFSSVRLEYTGFEGDSDTLHAVVRVVEQDYIQVDLAGGYISPEAVFGSAYWIQPNIMGNNQKLKLGGVYTRYISSANQGNDFRPEIVYEEPWFLSTRWTAQLKLGYHYLQRDHQEERRFSGEVALSRRISDAWRYTGGYTIARLRFRSTMEDSTELVRDWSTTARIRSSFTRDSRNPLLNPVEGSWFKAGGSVSGGFAGGSIDFYTVDSEYRLFIPVNRRLVLAGRVGGSVALGYGGNSDIPPNDRLYLGGGTTVRGYDHQTLGPVDTDGNPLGGNVMAIANAEARLRIIGNLGAALFCDAGGVWTDVQQISRGTTGFGTGMGLRFDTPIGPVRLDYGFAPTWSNSLKRGKVYFAIGQPF